MTFIIADRIKETSATTGTGALALGGAMTGFRSFSAVCAVGDTAYYALQAVDANGMPTGDWETGLATYSGVNTLTRTTVTASSNSGAAVSLVAGLKHVFLAKIAAGEGVFTAANGDVGIGTSTPATGFELVRDGSQADITATTYGVDGGGIVHGRMARGTKAAPSAVLAGDIFSGVGGRAYHSGGAFQLSSPASIHWVAAENQTPTGYGSYLRFLTTPKGSTSRVERVLITADGTLWAHGAGVFDPKNEAQTKPLSGINVLSSAGDGTGAAFASVSYGTGSMSGYRGAASAGTAASPTATPAETMVCFMGGHAYGASGWSAGTKALLAFVTSENWTDTAQGMYMSFGVTPMGSSTRAEAARIDPSGNFLVQQAGRGLRIKEGSNAKQGTATLVAGVVVVANTSVTANSRIFITAQSGGGTPGFLRVSARTEATSFTITSSSASDTSVVAYQIFEPA